MLLPHEQFAYLYEHSPNRFQDLIFDGKEGTDELSYFWTEATRRRGPRLKHHPHVHERNMEGYMQPAELARG